jgi:hypothetical protein
MERNLEAMQRKRMKLAGGDSSLSRAKVMAALNASGCRDEAVAERRLPRGIDSNSDLLERIFGGGIRPRRAIEDVSRENGVDENEDRTVSIPTPLDGSWVNDNGRIRFLAPPGQYRTLCVRTCDGYFFPMSNASSPADFERDQHNCEASCPGAEVQIYYHRTGEESAEMIDFASGAPYSELPAAYLYKQPGTPLPAGCGCNRSKNFEIVSGNPPPSDAVQSEPVKAKPTSGLDPAADPRTGGDDKKVRVVGPAFLPDPEAAIDLQAPAPTQGP